LTGPGLAPEIAVHADAEIPERRMTLTWSLRRNIDKALPASHTIEIKFNLPADLPGGGIVNVPGIPMDQAEQAHAIRLARLTVKVTNGFFVVALSGVDADVQRNEQLLKDRSFQHSDRLRQRGPCRPGDGKGATRRSRFCRCLCRLGKEITNGRASVRMGSIFSGALTELCAGKPITLALRICCELIRGEALPKQD